MSDATRAKSLHQSIDTTSVDTAALSQMSRQLPPLYSVDELVSAGARAQRSDVAKLQALQLPVIHNVAELAQQMGMNLATLRCLALYRRTARVTHDRRFSLVNKTGRRRLILAPMLRLKRAQYWILHNLLQKVPLHPATQGLIQPRSLARHSHLAANQPVVINLYLQSFCSAIAFTRIKAVFKQLGYTEQVASCLALLCSEATIEQVILDSEMFSVAPGKRALPQGAPTSLALSNLLCKRLDARLQNCAAQRGLRYIRYGDALLFWGDAASGKLLWRLKQIIVSEGFTPHQNKPLLVRQQQRDNPRRLVRDTLKYFYAMLFPIEPSGSTDQSWRVKANVLAALGEYACIVQQVFKTKDRHWLPLRLALQPQWPSPNTESPVKKGGSSDFHRLAAPQSTEAEPNVNLQIKAAADSLIDPLLAQKLELAAYRGWLINLWIQGAIILLLTLASRGSWLVLLLGSALLYYNYRSQQNNWKWFVTFVIGVLVGIDTLA